MAGEDEDSFAMDVERHVKFWKMHLSMLPRPYVSGDDQRMTFAYFCLSGLDLLQRTDTDCQADQREAYIAWIYDQQVPTEHGGGFRGSPTSSSAHIVMTYTALLCLSILRDDFARLDREGLRRHVHQLQKPDGSFLCAHGSREQDVRFSYAAFAIAYMLNDWSIMDCELAMTYMLRCQHYEGAFAQEPGLESHGGSTYCVVAAFALAHSLDRIPRREHLERWILSRQVPRSGFQGRVEKTPDTCYSFWCGASAQVLGCHNYIDARSDACWILSAQSPLGGIAKVPGEHPDILHSYLSYVALSLHTHDGLTTSSLSFAPVSCALNLSRSSLAWMHTHLAPPPSYSIP